ncbi:MAG: tetratricopeptide repeat protein [Acidimicrobiia bacterium]
MPTEKSLLRGLSVFRGGWTLEAAEAICVSATSSGQILDVLGSLVDKSLVEVTSTGPQNRYRLLETVRQYSQSHLQAEGEDETARQSHTHYFLRLAETSEAGLRGPDQAECVDRIEAEHDNIRTALSWTLDTGRRDEALKLVAAMGWFWFMRGYWKEALRWFSRAYLPAEGADPLLRAWAVCKTAAIEVYRAAPSKVADLVAEARETFDRSRDEFGFALATLLFAHVSAIDAPEEDERLCRSALRSFEELGAEWETAFTVGQLGGALAWSDNEDEGLALIRQGIEGLLALGDRWCASWIAFNLGATLAAKGRIEESRGVLEQAIDLAAGTGDRWAGPHTKGRLAIVSTMEGRPEEAKKLFAEALSLHDRIGDENCSSLCRMYLADVHLAEGDFEEAARRAREALIGYQSTENPAAVLSCVRRFGFISLEEGQHDRAATLLSATEAIRGDRPLTAFDQERLTAASDRLRGALGEVEYERHTAAGANLELEETVSLALER